MMKCKTIVLGLTFIIALSFAGYKEEYSSSVGSEPGQGTNTETITIASFNLQVFGQTKAGKADVMAKLAQIITRYDVVAVQEIRDAKGTAIQELERVIDAQGTDYEYLIGPRLGRTTSKEQYAYMYKVGAVTPGESYTYSDSGDAFHREPFITHFRAGSFSFVLINIHTDPDEATEEINALAQVVLDAQTHFSDEDDFIILGDLNADCAYFDEGDMTVPLRGGGYTWLIQNLDDTNIAQSDCTYDRIIVTAGVMEDYTGDAGVFRFDSVYGLTEDFAKAISDHYPVYATFYVGRDTMIAKTTWAVIKRGF